MAQKNWGSWFVGSGLDVEYMNHHMCVSLFVHCVSAPVRSVVSLFWDQTGDTDVTSLHLVYVNLKMSPDGKQSMEGVHFVEGRKKAVTYSDTNHERVQKSLTPAGEMTKYCL